MPITQEFQAKAAHGMQMPRMVTGTVDLAAGAGTIVLPEGFDTDALILVSYSGDAVFTAANAGILRGQFEPSTSTLTIASSNNADDNTVRFLVMQ